MSDYHLNGWSPEIDRQDELKRRARMAIKTTYELGVLTINVSWEEDDNGTRSVWLRQDDTDSILVKAEDLDDLITALEKTRAEINDNGGSHD